MLKDKGYQKINNVLPLNFCNKLAKDFTENVIQQTPISYDVMRGFCWQVYKPDEMQNMLEYVKPTLEKALGEKLLPTYTYITAYTNNSYMTAHTDRPACEVSISVNLASTINWGLHLTDLQGKSHRLTTNVGDGIAYLGPKVEHWRDLLVSRKPEFYIQTFLHYVKADGEYSQCVDDRPFIPNGTHDD